MHFETLWEKAEKYHQNSEGTSQSMILDELMLKLNLYKAVSSKTELPAEELEKAKFHTMGEILLTLTHLSLYDKINVFDALYRILRNRSVDFLDKKHST